MRAILVILGLAALVVIGLISLGMLRIEQTASGTLPSIRFEGGRAPQFKADMGKVGVGTVNKTVRVPTVEMRNTTVAVPTLEMRRADNAAEPAQ